MQRLLIGIATSTLLITGALAHEAEPVITIEPTYMPDAGFDWNGFYMGLGITGTGFTPFSGTMGSIDLIAGVNVTSGNLLFGLEGWVSGWRASWGGSDISAGIGTRVGYLATPEMLLYASGGGQFYTDGAQYGTIGAGVEFAVTDNVSIDLEYKYWGWSNTIFTANSFGLSTNWGF